MKSQKSSLAEHRIPRGAAPHASRIVPVFDGLNLIEVKSRYEYLRHQHLGFEVILVDRGRYRCRLNNRELVLRPGDVLVVKPRDWHQDFLVPPLRYFGLTFHLDRQFLGGLVPSLFVESVTPEQQHFHMARNILWPIIDRIHEEQHIGDRVTSHVQDALLHEFFWLLVRNLPPKAVSPELLEVSQAHGFTTQLLRLFQSRINGSSSLSEMAQALNISTSSLAHKCQAILRLSPMQAFVKCKIERAHLLLRETSMTVKEIGAHLGFKDPYHFSKVFKRHAGVPPSEYR